MTFYQKAIWLNGNAHSIVLDLSHEIQHRLRQKGAEGWNHLRRRIDRYIVRICPCPVDYWLALEESPQGQLHLNGGANCDENALPYLRKALYGAGGKSAPTFSRYQVYLRRSYGGDRWPAYAAKEMHQASKHYIGFAYTCSQSVGRDARNMYEAERRAVLELLASGRWSEVERLATEDFEKFGFATSYDLVDDDFREFASETRIGFLMPWSQKAVAASPESLGSLYGSW